MPEQPRLCVLGAAGDTSNLGVSALLEATLIGIRLYLPEAPITAFDNGLGRRHGRVASPDGDIEFEQLGIRASRRVYRSESLSNMALARRIPVLRNRGLDRLIGARAVLDISGGDSFSDIYGPNRFKTMSGQKQMVLDAGSPLVLLPQTYGPFHDSDNETIASRLVAGSALAWARDDDSYVALRHLAGDDFDPQRHRRAVDVAFGLPARRPANLARAVDGLLSGRSPVCGVNVSGLLANDENSARRFGLRDHHQGVVIRLLEALLNETDASILLVPHVRSSLEAAESDIAACRRTAEMVGGQHRERVAVLEDVDAAQEVKWVIGACEAFVGARMHSVIAALSSRVPALALAYSPKFRGVLASCRQADRAVDLRSSSTDEVVKQSLDLWHERDRIRSDLDDVMPEVIAASRQPFAEIARSFPVSIPSDAQQ